MLLLRCHFSMFARIIIYISLSNAILLCSLLDSVSTHADFFSRMNALANSMLFTAIAGNALAANIILLWLFVTFLFFFDLSTVELSAARQIFVRQFAEFGTAFFFYGYQKVFEMESLVTHFSCLLFYLWGALCEVRLDTLVSMESGLWRQTGVLRLTFFLLFMCEMLSLFLTRVGSAHQAEKFFDSENTINVVPFLHLSLILLGFLECTLRLLFQELSRCFTFHGFQRGELVYARHIVSFLKSIVYLVLVTYTFSKSSPAYLCALGQIYLHAVNIFRCPVVLYRYFSVTRLLQCVPSVSEEVLAREEVVCTICYEPIDNPNGTRCLPCSHAFHESCLRQWFEEHTTCPYCRADLLHAIVDKRKTRVNREIEPETSSSPATSSGGGSSPFEGSHVSARLSHQGDIEEEIQLAFLQYMKAASVSNPVAAVTIDAHTGTPLVSPLPTAEEHNTEANKVNFEEKSAEKLVDFHSDNQNSSSPPLIHVGEHISTLRFLPAGEDSIKNAIQYEEAVERKEFLRAAAAIASDESVQKKSMSVELVPAQAHLEEASLILDSKKPEKLHDSLSTPFIKEYFLDSRIDGNPVKEINSDPASFSHISFSERKTSLNVEEKGHEGENHRRSTNFNVSDDVEDFTEKIILKFSGASDSSPERNSSKMSADVLQSSRSEIVEAVREFRLMVRSATDLFKDRVRDMHREEVSCTSLNEMSNDP